MKVLIDGVSFDAISADVEKGEAVLALLDADGNAILQPNGEPDSVTRRGVVELIETTKKKWSTDK